MANNTNNDIIACKNCNIVVKLKKNKLVAVVKWFNGIKQLYSNEHDCPKKENKFIIPHSDHGFYFLNGNKIMHIIDDTKNKIVVYDDSIKYNWFGKFDDNEILYFPKYNVLICTFFGGDHDYIWWWKLNVYNQYANIEKPCYYNGIFNASLNIYKANDRYAVGTYYNYTDNKADEDSDSEDYDDENIDIMTIIFDTKKMVFYEYTREELKKELHIKTKTRYALLEKKLIEKKYND